MSAKVQRIMGNLRAAATEEQYGELMHCCADSLRQNRLTPLLQKMGEKLGPGAVRAVMQTCGEQCIPRSLIDRARLLHERCRDLPEFLELLNRENIGGGHLQLRDDLIVGIYEHCYCELVGEEEDLPASYCHCSAGWYRVLFQSVYGVPAEVEPVQTMLGGADTCVFEIRLTAELIRGT